MFYEVNDIVSAFVRSVVSYLPYFFGGLLIFALGLILSQIVRRLLKSGFEFFKFDLLLKKTKLASQTDVTIWKDILIELLGWSVVILFLIPAAEVWGLPQVTVVLNQLLFYIPNVLVAVIVGFIGLVFAGLVSDLVRHSVHTAGSKSSNALATLARYAIIFFTILVVMNQLGIAQDLIRILFTGIIAMLAIAGGLAFGMGGKELAKDLLDEFKKSIS